MNLTEPPTAATRSANRAAAGGRGVREPLRPVSPAIDPAAAALYAAAMPRGATPWERHSHAFQGIYLKRARVILDGALDIGYVADQFAAHERDVTRPHQIACTCDPAAVFELHSELYVHQVIAFRDWALGDAL
jgi:hypothetical protein